MAVSLWWRKQKIRLIVRIQAGPHCGSGCSVYKGGNIDGVFMMDITRDVAGRFSRMEIVDSGRRRRFTDEAKLVRVIKVRGT